MTTENKFREFWVNDDNSIVKFVFKCKSQIDSIDLVKPNIVHVIEIAAVEQLKAENEKLKSLFSVQLDVMEQNNNMTTEITALKSRLLDFEGRTYSENQEIAALKSKLKIASAALEVVKVHNGINAHYPIVYATVTQALRDVGEG